MHSLNQIKSDYEFEGRPHLRVGQYFVGKYIEGVMPKLFYMESEVLCWVHIKKWLEDHQYFNVLPEPTQIWKDMTKGWK